MATNNCSFCDHANPIGAKFCNECGAGLGLRPCAQCEAINDISATYCHHCGALLGAPAATAVAGAAQAEGTAAEKTPAPTRPAEPIAQLTGAPASDVAGKPAPASARELASAAERLDAFWRDSMQAVEVARTMKGEEPPAAARQVDVLPLRVINDTPVIDSDANARTDRRRVPRAAIVAGLLLVVAAAVYYGYTRTIIRDAAPESSVPLAVTVPNAVQAEPTPAPPTTASAQSTRAPAQPTTSSAGTGPPATTATQPVGEATQSSAIRSDAAAAASPDPGAPGEATPSLSSPAAVTLDKGSQSSPPVASSPPATEAPLSTASDPPAPRADRPVESAAPPRAATPRRPSANEFRTATRTPRAPSSAGGVSPPVRRSNVPSSAVRPAPSTEAPALLAPPVPPAAPVITGNCTASVAALGLCGR